MNKSVRVLYVMDGKMSRGGTEAFIMNYFRHIDHQKVQIDIVQCGDEKGIYDEELKEAGCKLYYLPLKGKHPIAFSKSLKSICQKGKYQIIHGMMDTMNVWCLKIARSAGVSVCVAHSHNTRVQSDNKLQIAFNNWAKKGILKFSDHLMACSEAAGKWLFGENAEFTVVKNGVDYDLFKFDENKRKYYREQYQIEDKLVVGHVGQFRDQKNHMYLIDVFNEMHKLDERCYLVLIGTGPLLKAVESKISQLGLGSCVKIINGSDKVNELLNMFDCYLFPSKFEGLSIALVEAEVNGLKCYTSTSVSRESNVLKKVEFYDLSQPPKTWAENILKEQDSFKDRAINKSDLEKTGYDIESAAKKLEDFYIDAVK